MDGSQKIPVRLIGTWLDREAIGLASPSIEQAISAWCQFVYDQVSKGIAVQDPVADQIHDLFDKASDTTQFSISLLKLIKAPSKLIIKLFPNPEGTQ